jgi:hypothetical protein
MRKGMHRNLRDARRLLPFALVVFAFAASPAGAATYKWTDEDGKVHYSDKAPPEAPKGATVLDKQARPVKKIDAPLSPEQLKARADEDERQKALAKAKDDQARKDRALMASYTSENEIDLARNRAVGTLDSQIKSAQIFTETLAKQQKAISARKESYAGKPLPVELEREAVSVDAEISRQNILIRQKQEELEMVAAKYDTIKQRWREILADKERAAAAERAAKSQAPAPDAAPAPGKAGSNPVTTAGKTK